MVQYFIQKRVSTYIIRTALILMYQYLTGKLTVSAAHWPCVVKYNNIYLYIERRLLENSDKTLVFIYLYFFYFMGITNEK